MRDTYGDIIVSDDLVLIESEDTVEMYLTNTELAQFDPIKGEVKETVLRYGIGEEHPDGGYIIKGSHYPKRLLNVRINNIKFMYREDISIKSIPFSDCYKDGKATRKLRKFCDDKDINKGMIGSLLNNG